MKKINILGAVFTFFFYLSCTTTDIVTVADQKPDLSGVKYQYRTLELPRKAAGFGKFFIDNGGICGNCFTDPNNVPLEITDAGATLGRVLFYDKKLSLNNTVACGTCHLQSKAFSDGAALSEGFQGKITSRNSMAISNPILLNNLFWDSRSSTIEDLSLRPVQNHIEMGMENLDNLVTKLAKTDYYPNLFKAAYQSTEISQKRISNAIAQFVGSITSNKSKFDASEDDSNLSSLEKLGKVVFIGKGKCVNCHAGVNFSAPDGPFDPYGGGGESGIDEKGTANIGLELVYNDNGRKDGKFRIPSLRNIEVTAPYMHDGRFKTLEEVIDHYSEGIKPHPALDKAFKDSKGNLVPLHLDALEKTALIAFLKTLTDHSFLKDPKYADPFK